MDEDEVGYGIIKSGDEAPPADLASEAVEPEVMGASEGARGEAGKQEDIRLAELNLQIAQEQRQKAEAEERAEHLRREREDRRAERRANREREEAKEKKRQKHEGAKEKKRQEREAEKEVARRDAIERKRERKEFWRSVGGAFLRLVTSLPRIGKLALVVAVVAIVAGAVIGINAAITAATPTEVNISTRLEKMINISELSTARVLYNGVAEQKDDEGNVTCHIYYEAAVDISIDMADVEFEVDEENRVVHPMLPAPELGEPALDASTVAFFEDNPDISTAEAISLCKQDALTEVGSTGQIYEMAERNLRLTIEALTEPLLDDRGYRIDWEEPEANESEGENDESAQK